MSRPEKLYRLIRCEVSGRSVRSVGVTKKYKSKVKMKIYKSVTKVRATVFKYFSVGRKIREKGIMATRGNE